MRPFPGALKEALASELSLCESFGFHLCDDPCLSSYGSVVGAGEPESCIALHTLSADKYILKRFVKGVPHVELTGDVRRRDNYGIGLFPGIALSVEISVFLPVVVDTLFKILR